MENLHLSYYEVTENIPYRNLIMMQRDKQHEGFGDVVKKVSGKDFAARRKNR